MKEDMLLMKRILCIILALGLLAGTISFAYAEEDEIQFTDEELKEMEEEEEHGGEAFISI